MVPGKAGFRRDIEGLRAIAVLLVIVYHADLLRCQGGFIGVDVFFVLSGYLITGILAQEALGTGSIDLVQFYARRIRRLVPASLMMLLAVVVASYIFLSPFEQPLIAKCALATATYLSNMYFAKIGTGYFAADVAANPLVHTWSLAAEEQFYLIWPLLLLLIYRWSRSIRVLCWVIAGLGAVSFAMCVWMTRWNQPFAFFLMPPRIWEFAAGALASQSRWLNRPRRSVVNAGMGWAGLGLIMASGFLVTANGFPGIKAFAPVLGTVLVLLAGSRDEQTGAGQLLSSGPLQYLGQRSYGIYLWHWPMLVFGALAVHPFSPVVRVLCVVGSIATADVTLRVVENPIRFHPLLRSRPWACIAASVLVMVAVSAGATAWKRWSMHTQNYKTYQAAMEDIPEDWAMGCEVGYRDSTPRRCDFGSREGRKAVVLFGDSHMEQWLPAFQTIAVKENWKVILFTKSACPALAITTAAVEGAADHSCDEWRKRVIEQIRGLHPDAVFLSNATRYSATDGGSAEESAEEWRRGAHETFAALESVGMPLIFLRDTPVASYDVTACLSREHWHGLHPCASLPRTAALSDAAFRAQVEGAEGVASVHFVDLSDRLCGIAECDLVQGHTVIYRGSNHLTGSYLRSLADELYRRTVRNVPSLAGG